MIWIASTRMSTKILARAEEAKKRMTGWNGLRSDSTGGWAVMTESKEQVIEAEVELGGGNGGVEGANGLVGDDDGLGGV